MKNDYGWKKRKRSLAIILCLLLLTNIVSDTLLRVRAEDIAEQYQLSEEDTIYHENTVDLQFKESRPKTESTQTEISQTESPQTESSQIEGTKPATLSDEKTESEQTHNIGNGADENVLEEKITEAADTEESRTQESKTEESKTEESEVEQAKTEESETEASEVEESETEETTTEEELLLMFSMLNATADATAADASAEFQIMWADNNDAAKERPQASFAAELFTVYDSSENKIETAVITATELNYSIWTVTVSGLVEGERYYLEMEEQQEYKTTYDVAGKNYSEGKIVNQYLTPINCSIHWKDGNNETTQRPEKLELSIYASTAIDVCILSQSVTAQEGDSWSFSCRDAALPAYDADGADINYMIKTTGTGSGTGGDYYEVTYDNGAITTDTSNCRNGGSIVLTLRGTATFEGSKEWLDDNDANAIAARKASNATLALWRYPKKSGYTWEQGSPVKIAGNSLTYVVKTDSPTDNFTMASFPNSSNLPKYDEDGYSYVYFVKETISGEYLPKLENTADYIGYTGADTVLYDKGKICNVRSNDMTIPVEVIWHAKATSYAWENLPFDVELQRKRISETTWTIVDNPTVERKSMQDYVYTVPMFDEMGRSYQYRAASARVGTTVTVKYDRELEPGSTQKSSESSFHISSGEDYHYESCLSGKIIDGKAGYVVENWLKGKAVLIPIKRWKGEWKSKPEVTYEITRYANNKQDSTFQINGSSNVTSSPHAEIAPPSTGYGEEWAFTTTYWEGVGEAISGKIIVERFNSEGYEYTYFVKEVGPTDLATYAASGSYYTETYYNQLANTEIMGELAPQYQLLVDNIAGEAGKVIEVEKEWLDDGDIDHRGAVRAVLYKKIDEKQYEKQTGSSGDGTGVTLTAGNQWKGRISIPAGDDYNNYIVLEESIGGKTVSYEGLDNDTGIFTWVDEGNDLNYAGKGTVSAQTHQYKVSVKSTANTSGTNNGKRTYYKITNLRVGKLDIDIEKTWKDGETTGVTVRPTSVTFTLSRDRGAFSEQSTTLTSAAITQKVQRQEASFTNLDKYDSQGAAYTYTVTETSESSNYKNNVVIEETTHNEPYTSDSKDIFTAKVTNYREQLEDISVNVIWRDADKKAVRPDIYLTILRHTEGEAENKWDSVGYVEPKWGASTHEGDETYHLRCTFQNMPRYNSEGKYYSYAFVETITANADQYAIYSYSKDSGGLVENGQTPTDLFCNLTTQNKGEAYLQAKVIDNGKGGTPEGGTIVNCIHADVKTIGVKTWLVSGTGITDKSQLPKVTLTLNRKLKNVVGSTYGKITGINSVTLADGASSFTFSNTDGKSLFSKYNEYGQEYDYTVKETFDTGDEEQNKRLDILYPDDDTHRVFDELTFGLKNVMDTQYTRGITINKTWENLTVTDFSRPYAKFNLYRYQAGQNIDTKEKVKTLLIKAEGAITDHKIEKTESFTDLQVFAPNGILYVYVVEEDNTFAPSYEITGITATGGTVAADNSYVTISNQGVSLSKDANKTVSFHVPEASVSCTNHYKSTSTFDCIKGSIQWEDYDNKYSSRPFSGDGIKLTVKRTAVTQSGVSNITNETVSPDMYKIEWKYDAANNKWTYAITPEEGQTQFPVYAPNGTVWKYTVTETLETNSAMKVAENYRIAANKNSSTKEAPTDSAIKEIEMDAFVNQLYKMIQVDKTWEDAEYGLRPMELAFTLSAKEGNTGNSWKELNAICSTTPNTLVIEPDTKGIWNGLSVALPQYKIGGTEQAPDAIEYQYRITEEVPASYECVVVSPEGAEDNSAIITLSNEKNVVAFKNKVVGSTVKVLLEFTNDKENAYHTRPETVEVVLMRRKKESTVWEEVTKTNSIEKVIFEVKKDELTGKYVAEYHNLPSVSADNKEYEYCVEVNKPITESDKSYIYGYEVETYQAANSDSEAGDKQVDTYIVATLPTVDLSVEKTWEDVNNQDGLRPEQVEIVLLDSDSPMTDLSGAGVTMEFGKTPSGTYKWKDIFRALPKYQNAAGDSLTLRKYTVIVNPMDAGNADRPIPEYTTLVKTGTEENSYQIISNYTPKTKKLKINKIWEDFDNHFMKQPESIDVYIKAEIGGRNYYVKGVGEAIAFCDAKEDAAIVQVKREESWERVVEQLPVFQNATGTATESGISCAVTYSLEEGKIAEYHSKSCVPSKSEAIAESSDTMNFTLTNEYELVGQPKTLEVSLTVTDKEGNLKKEGTYSFRIEAKDDKGAAISPDTLLYSYTKESESSVEPVSIPKDGVLTIDISQDSKLAISNIAQGTTVSLTALKAEKYITKYEYTEYEAGTEKYKDSKEKVYTAQASFSIKETYLVTSASIAFTYKEASNIISIGNITKKAGDNQLPPLGGTVKVESYGVTNQMEKQEDQESVSAATEEIGSGTEIKLIWTPQAESTGGVSQIKTWGTGDSIEIDVNNKDGSPAVTFTYERQPDNSWVCSSENDNTWSLYGMSPLLQGTGSILSDAVPGKAGSLIWKVTKEVNVPYAIDVRIQFVPTLIVENVTAVEDIDVSTGQQTLGGKVRTESSSLDEVQDKEKYDKADGGAEDEENTSRYLAETRVYGMADTGNDYVVDMEKLVIGLPESFAAINRADVANKFANAIVGRDTVYLPRLGAGPLPKVYTLKEGAFHVTFDYAGRQVPIDGNVIVTATNAKGFATEVEVVVSSLIIPLDVGIPFITEKEAIRRKGSSAGGAGGSGNEAQHHNGLSVRPVTVNQGLPVTWPWFSEDTLVENLPQNPEETDQSDYNSAQPKTGDSSNELLTQFFLFAGLACCGMGTLLYRRRRRRDSNNSQT